MGQTSEVIHRRHCSIDGTLGADCWYTCVWFTCIFIAVWATRMGLHSCIDEEVKRVHWQTTSTRLCCMLEGIHITKVCSYQIISIRYVSLLKMLKLHCNSVILALLLGMIAWQWGVEDWRWECQTINGEDGGSPVAVLKLGKFYSVHIVSVHPDSESFV